MKKIKEDKAVINRQHKKFQKLKKLKEVKGSIEDNIGKHFVDLTTNVLGVVFNFDIGKQDDVDIDLRQLFSISRERIAQDAEELPTKLGQLGILSARMKTKLKKFDIEIKNLYAEKFKKYRGLEKFKGVNDTQLGKIVESNKEYRKLVLTKIEYEEQIEILDVIYWSLKEKVDIIKPLLNKA